MPSLSPAAALHVMRQGYLCNGLALLLLLPIGFAGAAPALVANMTAGTGPGQVGVLGGAEDAGKFGPPSFAVLPDESLVVLDAVNLRLNVISKRGFVKAIALDTLRAPRDLAFAAGKLYVWDDGVVQVAKYSAAGGLVALPRHSGQQESSSLAARAARSAFSDAGLVGKGGGDNRESAPAMSVTDSSGRSWNYRVARQREGLALKVWREDGEPTTLVLPLGGVAEGAALIAIDTQGNFYVRAEQFNSAEGAVSADIFVAKFNSAGKRLAYFALPDGEGWVTSGRVFSISPTGRVYVANDADGFGIHELSASSERAAPSMAVRPTKALVEAARSIPDERVAILARADLFYKLAWPLAPANYNGKYSSVCDKSTGKFWLRPSRLNGKTGETIKAVPYAWGVKDTLDGFSKKIRAGALAGNVCTCRDPAVNDCVIREVAGIDCSGLVSRAWDIAPLGTSGLAGKGRPRDRIEQLLPGDILNKAGSHVILFVAFNPTATPPSVTAYESSLHCDGVCRRDIPLRQLRGYKLYSPAFLER